MSDSADIPQIRYLGPYQFRGQWRCQLVNGDRRTWMSPEKSPERALAVAERFVLELTASQPLTIAEGIERYGAYLKQIGNKPASYEGTPLRLRCFFAKVLGMPLSSLTPPRCAALYQDLTTKKSERTGKPLAVATHKAYLADARSFGTWAAEQKLIRSSPLANIKPIGRANTRKMQLRHNEARRLASICLELAPHDDGALAVLVALLMGLRAGEIVTRTVRDLDDNGRILWIDDIEEWSPKTAAARRPVEVPAPLLPLLMARTQDKRSGALVFQGKGGARHDRGWVRKETRRLCELAGVPVVCAHSLRGFHATAAVAAGASPHIVAAALGHESASITLTSYAAPGSAACQPSFCRLAPPA